MKKIFIHNARIVNEGRTYAGSVLIAGDKIAAVHEGASPIPDDADVVIDASGKYLLP